MEFGIQDEIQANSQKSKGCDSKLKVMNQQDDVSCWSDSQCKSGKSSFIVNEEFFDFSQENVKKKQKSILRKSSGGKEGEQYFDKSIVSPNNSFLIKNNERHKQQTDDSSMHQWLEKSSINNQQKLPTLNGVNEEELEKQQNTHHTHHTHHTLGISKSQATHKPYTNGEINQQLKINIKFISILKMKIQRFINKFTINGRTKFLKNEIRQEINDFSDILSTDNQYSGLKIVDLFIYHCIKLIRLDPFKKIPILNPQSTLGFTIQIIFTTFSSVFLFLFSLILIFQGFLEQKELIYILVRLVWSLEILIKLNTASYFNLIQIYQRNKIIQNYIKTRFVFDILPIIMLSTYSQNYYLFILMQILVFLKIFNILEDYNNIQKKIFMMVKSYYIIQLFNLVIKIFIIGHVIACMWYIIALIELNLLEKDKTWFDDVQDIGEFWWQYYTWAIYWSLTLMTTGSNISTSVLQASFTSFIMLFTTITTGYLLNVIGIILSEMDETQHQKRKDVTIINEYMRNKNISLGLQAQVNLNLDYYYQNNFKKINEDNQSALEKISLELQNQILKEYNKQILSKISFLQQNFCIEVLDELSLFVKEEHYFPNEIILEQSEEIDPFIMIVISGLVEIGEQSFVDNQYAHKKQLLKENQIFGEINFFSGFSSQVSLRTRGFTRILKVVRSDFINIIKNREKEYEIFCQIRDKVLMYRNYQDLNIQCQICNISTHLSCQCSFLHLDKEFVNLKASLLQSTKQVRSEIIDRKASVKVNTLKMMSYFQEKVKIAMKDLIKYFPGSANRIDYYQTVDVSNSSQDDDEYSDQNFQIYSDNNNLDSQSRKIFEQQQTVLSNQQKLDSFHHHTSHTHDMKSRNEYTRESMLSCNEIEDPNNQYENIKHHNLKDQGDQLPNSQKQYSESMRQVRKSVANDFPKHIKNVSDRRESSFKQEMNNNDIDQGIAKSLKRVQQPRKSKLKPRLRQVSMDMNNESQFDKQKSVKVDAKSLQHAMTIQQSDFQNNYNSVMVLHNNVYDEEQDDLLSYNPWQFDTQKDFKHYFVYGNSKYSIQKYQRILKKRKQKKIKQTNKKTIHNN